MPELRLGARLAPIAIFISAILHAAPSHASPAAQQVRAQYRLINPLEPEDHEKAAQKYATFIVARAAGLSFARSHALSFFSQFPDDEYCLNAITASNEPLRIRDTIHALHGGGQDAVAKRRSDLRALIKQGIHDSQVSDLQIGFFAHALSDSYAHTTSVNGEVVAYGAVFGHAWNSFLNDLSGANKDPDRIAHFPCKFASYACDLFQAMTSRHRSCRTGLAPLLALVDNLQPQSLDELPRMRALALASGFNTRAYAALATKYGLTSTAPVAPSHGCSSNIPQKTMFSVMRLMERAFHQ